MDIQNNSNAARVQWSISADVECPHCLEDNDFMQVDEYWIFCEPGEYKEKFFHSVEMTCQHCGKDFTIDGSDY